MNLQDILMQNKLAAAEEAVEEQLQAVTFNYMDKVAAELGIDLEVVATADPELFETIFKIAADDVEEYFDEEVDPEEYDMAGEDDLTDEDVEALDEIFGGPEGVAQFAIENQLI